MSTKTIRVPHLAATTGYRIAAPVKHSKPTLILVNSFMHTSEQYKPQFANEKLTEAYNLVAIEPLGHGETRTAATETYTYWDSALIITQVMDALGIRKAFIAGTSQGGWIAIRVALYIPDRIVGVIPIGTSMDREGEGLQKRGCTDNVVSSQSILEEASAPSAAGAGAADWQLSDGVIDAVLKASYGQDVPQATRDFWTPIIKKTYSGTAGRKKLRQSTINLRERDGLHGRLADITQPVLWLQGDADDVFSVDNARSEIKLFTGSPSAEVTVIAGAKHLAGWTHPDQVNDALAAFIAKFNHLPNARALRESIGTVDM